MTITAPADAGNYVVSSTATIPQNVYSPNTVLSTSYSFMLTVLSDCVDTNLTDKIINDMTTQVS
jgi:hypothetical protein